MCVSCGTMLSRLADGDVCICMTRRLQGSERDGRLPGQSSHGGVGLLAGPRGVDQLLKQSSNHPLVSYHQCAKCVCVTTFTQHHANHMERGRQLSACVE